MKIAGRKVRMFRSHYDLAIIKGITQKAHLMEDPRLEKLKVEAWVTDDESAIYFKFFVEGKWSEAAVPMTNVEVFELYPEETKITEVQIDMAKRKPGRPPLNATI